jgi:hypothetical protein
MMAIGTASLLAAVYQHGSTGLRYAAIAAMPIVGVIGIAQAAQRDVFSMADGEAKYIEIARVTETLSSPDDVIITAQYSGSERYYAGRLTLRWDFIEPDWLDDTVRWLEEHGHHPYLLLEEGEAGPFRERFASKSAIGELNWMPLVSFRNGAVKLYDVVKRDQTARPLEQQPLRAIQDCPVQRPSPQLLP